MKRRATFLAPFVALAGNVFSAEPKYPAFEVTSHDEPKVTFQFSASDASRSSPVVITIPGRKLTNEDRKHRVSLQKHWISLHAPESFELVSRVLIKCGLKNKGEYPYCDLYEFEDPATKRRTEFYIYVGNWP